MFSLQLSKFLYSSLPYAPIQTAATIISKTKINHDCYIYRLKFIDHPFELKVGEHFRIIETIKTFSSPEGEEVIRKYTPINPCFQKDVMDVLIKIYRSGQNIQFPNGGKLTPYL